MVLGETVRSSEWEGSKALLGESILVQVLYLVSKILVQRSGSRQMANPRNGIGTWEH